MAWSTVKGLRTCVCKQRQIDSWHGWWNGTLTRCQCDKVYLIIMGFDLPAHQSLLKAEGIHSKQLCGIAEYAQHMKDGHGLSFSRLTLATQSSGVLLSKRARSLPSDPNSTFPRWSTLATIPNKCCSRMRQKWDRAQRPQHRPPVTRRHLRLCQCHRCWWFAERFSLFSSRFCHLWRTLWHTAPVGGKHTLRNCLLRWACKGDTHLV